MNTTSFFSMKFLLVGMFGAIALLVLPGFVHAAPNSSVVISVSPTTIASGDSVLISWNAKGATSCDGTNFSTNGATRGSVTVTPTGKTTYSITCDGTTTSSTPGTWKHAFTDYTDLWCPITNDVFNQTWLGGGDRFCPTNNVVLIRNSRSDGLTPIRTNTGDPTGLPCSGSEVCILNSNNSCVVVTKLYRCNGGTTARTQVSDSASVSYNRGPSTPAISGPTTGSVGTNYTFSFVATDPDNDKIRYRIDWDRDGSTRGPGDQVTSYVNSGISQSGSRSWGSPGTYTFQAYTQDANFAVSSPLWRTHTITIGTSGGTGSSDGGGGGGNAPQCSNGVDDDGDGLVDTADPGCNSGGDNSENTDNGVLTQCSDGIDNDNDGKIDYPDDLVCISPSDDREQAPEAVLSLSAFPSLTRSNTATEFSWGTINIQSCVLSGNNGDSWILTGISGTQTSSPLITEAIFVLACSDLDGKPVSTSITVKILPSFTEE